MTPVHDEDQDLKTLLAEMNVASDNQIKNTLNKIDKKHHKIIRSFHKS